MKRIKLSKKQWVFAGLVVLLCITGVVNYLFSEAVGGQNSVVVQGGTQDEAEETSAGLNFYATFREERTLARNQEIEYLDSIIEDERTDAQTLKTAQEQKLDLVSAIEMETTVEGLIKAEGYADCVVTIRTGSVNVVVESAESLTSAQAAQIFEIVRKETGEPSENIKIMPRN